MRIKNKITLLFTLLVTSILLIITILIYYISANERKLVFNKRLKSRASNNAQVFDYLGDSSVATLRRIDASTLAVLPRKTVIIADTTGEVLYDYRGEGAAPVSIDESLRKRLAASNEYFFETEEREAIALYYKSANSAFIILVAAYDEDGLARLSDLRKVLTLSILIGILVTFVTGILFSSQLVRPIKNIIQDVNEISSNNLSKRLSAGKSQDELNLLSQTFNDLLNRLQESFVTQRRFISNASHELSTPLTSISSQLQVTLQKRRTTGEYENVLHSIQEDVELMRQLTKSLLEIAKTGSQGSIELKDLRVDELLLKVIADILRSNAGYTIDLQVDELPEDEQQCIVFGNADLLYIAFKNIIDNGCKYSADKRSVVSLNFEPNTISIKVTNQGDIIAEQEIEQIFQPFYRRSNNKDMSGFGLGLPLARRIISLHKGNIMVSSGAEGTIFTIVIPAAQA